MSRSAVVIYSAVATHSSRRSRRSSSRSEARMVPRTVTGIVSHDAVSIEVTAGAVNRESATFQIQTSANSRGLACIEISRRG